MLAHPSHHNPLSPPYRGVVTAPEKDQGGAAQQRLLNAALALLLLLPLIQLLLLSRQQRNDESDTTTTLPPPTETNESKREELQRALAECATAAQQWKNHRDAITARIQDPDAELSEIFEAEALRNPNAGPATPAEPSKGDLQRMLTQATTQVEQYTAHMAELQRALDTLPYENRSGGQ